MKNNVCLFRKSNAELRQPRWAPETHLIRCFFLLSPSARAHTDGSEPFRSRCVMRDILKQRVVQTVNMGMASEDLLVTLQILPGFFSNCLFLALYDSVVLVRRVVSLLSCSRSPGPGEWRPMLTSAGLRSIWNSFLLDAYKQVKSASDPRNVSKVSKPFLQSSPMMST